MSNDKEWRRAEIEVTKNKIIIDAGSLYGFDLDISEYNRKDAVIVVSVFTGEFPRKTFSITKDGVFFGNRSHPNAITKPLDKNEDHKDLEICEELRLLIVRHDPELEKILPEFKPA